MKFIAPIVILLILITTGSVFAITVDSYDTILVIANVSESYSIVVERYESSTNSGTTGDIYFGEINFGDTWVLGDVYIKVTYFSNKQGWGLRCFVDNSDSGNGASPYVSYSLVIDTGNYHAGLVGMTDTTHTLSMKVIARSDTTVAPQIPSDNSDSDANYGWRWLMDVESPSYDLTYATLVSPTNAQDYGQDVRIDFAVNSKGAAVQQYKTNRLFLEFYHE